MCVRYLSYDINVYIVYKARERGKRRIFGLLGLLALASCVLGLRGLLVLVCWVPEGTMARNFGLLISVGWVPEGVLVGYFRSAGYLKAFWLDIFVRLGT